jgi:hypothetical protein
MRCTVSVTRDMYRRLREERERRFLESVPETIRVILSEYLATHPPPKKEPQPAERVELET